MSHPTWVRGLKHATLDKGSGIFMSHPTWVRELKQQRAHAKDYQYQSHPTWVRELKLVFQPLLVLLLGRTLRGCVD